MCFINGGTSILAGFAIFSILGFMSETAHKPIADIVKPGVGREFNAFYVQRGSFAGIAVAFLAYPEVASNLPLKQLWAFLFFLMITILGLDSQVCKLYTNFFAYFLPEHAHNYFFRHDGRPLYGTRRHVSASSS